MSRYTVVHGDVTVVYGYDLPLNEYFVDVCGPANKVRQVLTHYNHDYYVCNALGDCPDEGDEMASVNLIGGLSTEHGGKTQFLHLLFLLGVGGKVPANHLKLAASDLPF